MSHKPIINQLVILLAVVAFFSAISLQLQRRGPVQSFDRFPRIAAALEAYALDHNGKYPPHKNPTDYSSSYYLPDVLTTPVSYLMGPELLDPLAQPTSLVSIINDRYRYVNLEMAYVNAPALLPAKRAVFGEWVLWSPGYDRTTNSFPPTETRLYDPTNGMMSTGDIVRSQKMLLETGVE